MREVVVEHDGLRHAVLDWGGDGEPLLLLHPNGFCAGLFDPLARCLGDRFRPIGIDLRGHGGTDTPVDREHGFAFTRMAADVVAVLDALEVSSCVALGESLGGGVATLVDAARPGLIRQLLLCEAVAVDLAVAGRAPAPDEVARTSGRPGDGGNYMAVMARKRRAVWPDRTTVRASYASRPPLDVLEAGALDGYVRWGFVDRPDGQVELACDPEVEATIFEVSSGDDGARGAFQHLGALTAQTTVVHGDDSNLPAAWFAAQAARIGSEPMVLAGGHFFLQEDTDQAEALVRKHLR